MDERLRDLLVRGREHYERHEYDAAAAAFRELIASPEGSRYADVHNMLGVILHEQGDLAGAAERFERAVALNPRYTDAILSLAITYNDQGRFDDAKALYARLKTLKVLGGGLDPFVKGKIANMHAAVAQAYVDAGCLGEGILELRKAVDLCPTFVDLQTKLGSLYKDYGDLVSAREHYVYACMANPKYVPARVQLGVTLLAMGAPDEAVAEWQAALEVDPDNKPAKMYLRVVEGPRAAASADLDATQDEPTIAIPRKLNSPDDDL